MSEQQGPSSRNLQKAGIPKEMMPALRASEVWADSRGEWSPLGLPASRQGMRKLPEEVA